MKKLLIIIAATFVTTTAFAAPTCNVPKEKWMKEADFKTKIESQGYKIKTFKVTNKNCYEIYGTDKNGKKAEVYFDPETAEVLLAK